jgi:hypothetical protein
MGFIIAQILGIIALIIVSVGYFLKKKTHFLLIQVVANLFYATAFIVVGAYVGGIITYISLFRCIFLYYSEKKDIKNFYPYLSIFFALYILTTIIFWKGIFDLIPLVTASLFTIGFSIKSLHKGKYILLVANILLVIYNILKTTYANAILDLIESIVLIIAIIKEIKEKKNLRNS